MIILAPTTDSLEIVTSAAVSLDYQISYAEHTSTGVTANQTAGNISTATTTTVISTSGSGVTRQVRGINIVNTTNFSVVTVTIQIDASGTNTVIYKCMLNAGESINFTDGRGWHTLSDHGRSRENVIYPYPEGYEVPILKAGNATEAAGVYYSPYASTGFPDVWAPGTPGVGGRAVSNEVGGLQISAPLTGYSYLEGFVASANVAASLGLIDVLWVNSGLVVTTTTAQTVNSVAFAARDLEETSNGRGVEIGILVTTATTNANAITTVTAVYTNSDGIGTRNASLLTFPQTCVAGSIIPFRYQEGDNGVRSIQTITLGTSLVTGAISLIAFRRVATVGCYNTNSAARVNWNDDGVRILSGSTILTFQIPTATTATTFQGTAYIHNMD